MSAKRKTAPRARRTASTAPAPAPVRLIVKRGAVERFEKLQTKTAGLDVLVAWDRRQGERREVAAGSDVERRKRDRRQQPSFTWEVADFAVAVSQADKT